MRTQHSQHMHARSQLLTSCSIGSMTDNVSSEESGERTEGPPPTKQKTLQFSHSSDSATSYSRSLVLRHVRGRSEPPLHPGPDRMNLLQSAVRGA